MQDVIQLNEWFRKNNKYSSFFSSLDVYLLHSSTGINHPFSCEHHHQGHREVEGKREEKEKKTKKQIYIYYDIIKFFGYANK